MSFLDKGGGSGRVFAGKTLLGSPGAPGRTITGPVDCENAGNASNTKANTTSGKDIFALFCFLVDAISVFGDFSTNTQDSTRKFRSETSRWRKLKMFFEKWIQHGHSAINTARMQVLGVYVFAVRLLSSGDDQ